MFVIFHPFAQRPIDGFAPNLAQPYGLPTLSPVPNFLVIGQGVFILWGGVENCCLPLTKPDAVNTGLALPRSP